MGVVQYNVRDILVSDWGSLMTLAILKLKVEELYALQGTYTDSPESTRWAFLEQWWCRGGHRDERTPPRVLHEIREECEKLGAQVGIRIQRADNMHVLASVRIAIANMTDPNLVRFTGQEQNNLQPAA